MKSLSKCEEKPYLVDGEPVSFRELIKRAEDEGYSSPDGLYTTSAAAAYLRKIGYIILENK
jgi:hypothetical protein